MESPLESWPDYRRALIAGLDGLEATGVAGAPMDLAAAFERWVDLTRQVHDADRALYLIGNGASAMIASHMAADGCKNGGLRATAFNDIALMSAIGNDLSFDEVFAVPLQRLARRDDLLISISSSGNST